MFREPVIGAEIPTGFQGLSPSHIYTQWASELQVSNSTSIVNFESGADDTVGLYEADFNIGNGQSNKIGFSSEGSVCIYNSIEPENASRSPESNILVPSSVSDVGNISRLYFPDNIAPSVMFYASASATDDTVPTLRVQSASGSIIILMVVKPYSGSGNIEVAIRIYSNGQIDVYTQPIGTNGISGIITLVQSTSVSSLSATNDGTDIRAITNGELTRIAIPPLIELTISGTVQDGVNNPIIRRVSAIEQETKRLRSSVLSSDNGEYSLTVDDDTDYIIICEDMGENPRNALVFDRVRGQ